MVADGDVGQADALGGGRGLAGLWQIQGRRLGKALSAKRDQRERDERGKSGKPGSHCGYLLRHDLGATGDHPAPG